MSLTDSELLALAVPIAATVAVGLMARLTYVSVMRRRMRLEAGHLSVALPDAGDELVEIKPEVVLSAHSEGHPRFFVRANSLRALLARSDA